MTSFEEFSNCAQFWLLERPNWLDDKSSRRIASWCWKKPAKWDLNKCRNKRIRHQFLQNSDRARRPSMFRGGIWIAARRERHVPERWNICSDDISFKGESKWKRLCRNSPVCWFKNVKSAEIEDFLYFCRSLVTVASMNGGNVLSTFVEAYRIEFSAIDDHLRNLEDFDKISAYPQARYYPERCGLEG